MIIILKINLKRGKNNFNGILSEDNRFQKNDEGTFWMTFSEFLREYDRATICRHHNNYKVQ